MTGLEKIKLGTDPERGWRYYSIHLTGTQVLKEFFLVSKYQQCIKFAFKHHERTEKNIKLLERTGRSFPYKKEVLANANELSAWAQKMDCESYHDLYINAFIGMWASFESGVENIIRDYVFNDKNVALVLSGLFKPGRYKIEEWPWPIETCMELAQKIDAKAKIETKDGGLRYANRLQKMFSWIGINLNLTDSSKDALDEANRVRNILLHRYGQVSEKDAHEFPILQNWVGGVMPIDKKKFLSYYNGIIEVLTMAVKNNAFKKDNA
ncbi:MAG: hypothetical protein LLG40_00925 [Deltaproteobacteria bacterium]|nr:hypothetical protein [Deltaproteobacteria bacterium]